MIDTKLHEATCTVHEMIQGDGTDFFHIKYSYKAIRKLLRVILQKIDSLKYTV